MSAADRFLAMVLAAAVIAVVRDIESEERWPRVAGLFIGLIIGVAVFIG